MRDPRRHRRTKALHQVAGHTHHTNRAIPRRDLSEAGSARVSDLGRVRAGEPQVFDSLTVSCRGCGGSIPPGEVFTRYPVPDDRRRDLTAPFCQTCRPITDATPDVVESTSPQDLISALRRGLERQARSESGAEAGEPA
jgi:hypothetical protein